MQYLKHINECLDDDYLNKLRNMTGADDGQVDDVNINTNNHKEFTHKEFTVVIFDLEEIQNKLFQFKMENETDLNNIRFFENQILIRNEEITRLEKKLKKLGQ